jgi:deoxycytidine triphosphate deaminase
VRLWRSGADRRPASLPPATSLGLAGSDEEAAARFQRWRQHDPYPGIQSALLNSADLQDYVVATGMIYPFQPGDDFLKPASYGVPLSGEVLYWEERFDDASGVMIREEKSFDFNKGEHLKLKRNSIVYVTLEPTLRLPDYIAARFNLTILDIYRGLLVGTGPLVDPGFTGQLHLPLHNYTANDYTIVSSEAFVWMEFTKLSVNDRWCRPVAAAPARAGRYKPFPARKQDRRAIKDYLKDHEAVTSSIPTLVEQARESARSAADDARRGRNISVLAGIAVIAGIAAMLVSVWLGFQDVQRERDQLQQSITKIQGDLAAETAARNAQQPLSGATRPNTGRRGSTTTTP